MLKIICAGNQWRGSDDGALFRAFSRKGHLISIADPSDVLPLVLKTYPTRILNRLFKNFFVREYNDNLQKNADMFKPDLVVVYKGTFVYRSTIEYLKSKNIPVINIYPDVSMFVHGKHIPECMPLYDYVFTTKSFGIEDIKRNFKRGNVAYMPHAFDPEVHRPHDIETNEFPAFVSDASFIGTFSPKKEKILLELNHIDPTLDLKIWGDQWRSTSIADFDKKIQFSSVIGDLYAVAVQLSKVNIAILSEIRKGSSAGDQITARTFQIPGTGGFMLHERTSEFLQYFTEGVDAEAFESAEELSGKIRFYLKNESSRLKIAANGLTTVNRFHKIDDRVDLILSTLSGEGIISKK